MRNLLSVRGSPLILSNSISNEKKEEISVRELIHTLAHAPAGRDIQAHKITTELMATAIEIAKAKETLLRILSPEIFQCAKRMIG